MMEIRPSASSARAIPCRARLPSSASPVQESEAPAQVGGLLPYAGSREHRLSLEDRSSRPHGGAFGGPCPRSLPASEEHRLPGRSDPSDPGRVPSRRIGRRPQPGGLPGSHSLHPPQPPSRRSRAQTFPSCSPGKDGPGASRFPNLRSRTQASLSATSPRRADPFGRPGYVGCYHVHLVRPYLAHRMQRAGNERRKSHPAEHEHARLFRVFLQKEQLPCKGRHNLIPIKPVSLTMSTRVRAKVQAPGSAHGLNLTYHSSSVHSPTVALDYCHPVSISLPRMNRNVNKFGSEPLA